MKISTKKKFNCSIGKKYKEPFSGKKFVSGLNLFNGVWWSKTFSEVYRIAVVAAIVFGLVFASGYWQGMKRKPILLGYKDFIAYATRNGVEHKVEVRSSQLYLDDKRMTVSDIPRLKPFGIRIRPKLFAGIGSEGSEVGLGAEIVHYFKWNLDVFGTQKAVYAGISWDVRLDGWIENSSVGLAAGKAWTDLEDTRFLFYWSVSF